MTKKRRLQDQNRRYRDALEALHAIADLALGEDKNGCQKPSIGLTESIEGIKAISYYGLYGKSERQDNGKDTTI